ncbi:protein shisa-6-like isoform X2 [Myxocyprinus asiaticus]|uniref:protein shisa-6-like isoform X2 n=1 Tax=Myxocyprinus asiaticus TaxID=70543 RepID=UPI002223BC10|nr:protein shisa-6-like isoform X2 [Myxocyprinus asiaticus]
MGIQHFLLLLIYLDPLNVLCTLTAKRVKPAPKRTQKAKELNNTTTVIPSASTQRITQVRPSHTHETCLGYFDVSGQFDKEFECNNTDHRYCCGSCYLRFCCQFKGNRLDQKTCKNYQKPDWVKTVPPSPVPTGDTYDPSMDQTNMAVYITCGVIAFIIVLGVSTKVAYDKATQPPQEMNIHRALADILRQQGPIPISQYDCENFAAMNSSPKGNTPQRTGSKNHYTPVHGSKSNHGGHYSKESTRAGSHDLHNFISSGFVTLGRSHVKGAHQQNFNHFGLSSPTRTPKNESTRMNSILTSQTEPYDLSFSRSFQSLSHLPPSYESAVKADLNKYSSLKRLTDKDVDDYYSRKRHIPDLTARGTLPLHMIKMNQESQSSQQVQQQQQQPPRQHPRRVQRAMSQDRVLSPEHSHAQDYAMSSYGMSPYGGRILSDEQLLSAERLRSHERLGSQDRLHSQDRHYSQDRIHTQDRLISQERHHSQERIHSQDRLYSQDRLHSQDPLISPDKMMSIKRSGFCSEKSMSRAMSNTDVFMPTTPILDRYKMTKMHSHPSASNSITQNILTMNQTASKRHAFASRRTQTVEQLHYVPQQQQHHHHYRTGSKTEVTV